MSLYPQAVVVRRSAEPGGTAPVVLRPGELWADVTPGSPTLWIGDGKGVPAVVAGGGASVSPTPPPAPPVGAQWFNTDPAVRELFIWDGATWTPTWTTADGGGF